MVLRHWKAFALCGALLAGAAVWLALRPAAGPTLPAEIDPATREAAVVNAIAEARDGVVKKPKSDVAWGKLGMTYLAHGFPAEARHCFQAAATLHANQFRWHYLLAIASEEVDLEAAQREYAASVAIRRDYAPLRFRYGVLLLRLNRLDEALAQFEAAQQIDPDSPFPLVGIGRIRQRQEQFPEAVEAFRKACVLAPWARRAHEELSRALARTGVASGAYQARRTARGLPESAEQMPDPVFDDIAELDQSSRSLAMQADRSIAQNRLPEATRLLRQLVRDRPELSRPQINLGQILQIQGLLPEARAVLQKAVEQFGDEPLACFTLARIEQELKQPERAIDFYRRACRAKPDYVEANYELGSLLIETGDVEGALDPLRRAVSAEPAFIPGHLKLSQALRALGQEDAAEKHAAIAEKLNGSASSRGPANGAGAGSRGSTTVPREGHADG